MIFGVFQMTATMRQILSCAFAVLALAWLTPASAQNAPPFRHGVALFHPLISATLQTGSKTQFVFPPFAAPRHLLTDAQLTAIKNAGFDFVRLPVDPGPFLQFKGAQRDAVDAIMRQRLQRILNAGLAVIVDFHPIPTSVDYGPKLLVQGVDTPLFRDYCAMLARTAQLLDSYHTNRVALELMNEPAAPNAAWQPMLEAAFASARKAAPQLTLILSGGLGSNYDGLTGLDPSAFDDKVLYTFHYYLPGEFTHQSYAPNPTYRLASDVPYPADARPLNDSISALRLRVTQLDNSPAQQTVDFAKGSADLVRYRSSGFSRADINSNFDSVAAWASSHRIPPSHIFLGEFGVIRTYGVYHGAREPERLQWLTDVRETAEAHHFVWSIWAYSGSGGMAIIKNDKTAEIDTATLHALGLGN